MKSRTIATLLTLFTGSYALGTSNNTEFIPSDDSLTSNLYDSLFNLRTPRPIFKAS